MIVSRMVRAGRLSAVLGVSTLLLGSFAIGSHAALAQLSKAPAQHAHVSSRAFANQGTVTLVTDGSAADLDPASEELSASDMVDRNIGETLVALNGSSVSQVVPQLATSWHTTNHGKTFIFNLRHNVRFHTGRIMTSADVVYSLQRTIKAGLTNAYLLSRFISNPNTQIKALNKYTVEIQTVSSQQFLLPALADNYVCMILDSKALKAHIVKGDYGHAYASSHDIGTGPYTIQSWQHDQQITLVRFPQYWGGWSGPHFSKVVIQTVPESSTRRELIEKGSADLTFDLTPEDYRALSANHSLRVIHPYGAQVEYIVFNVYGPLKSPAARQALSYAFDYNALINGAEKGFGRRVNGPIPHAILGYNPHGFMYQTDLSKARALLKKAGVKPGTTLTVDDSPDTDTNAADLILQAQLAQLGITLKIHDMTEATYNGIFYGTEGPSQRPNLMPFAWYPDFNDPYDMVLPWLASWNAGSAGANAGYYKDPRVDALLKQMKNAPHSLLISDAHKLQDIVTRQDPAAIWLDEPAQTTVMRSNLKGFVFNPVQIQTYTFYLMHR